MSWWPKIAGTTFNIFRVGLNKLVLDASNLTAERILRFPDSNGSNGNVLTTDGSGNLSWGAGGGGGGTPSIVVEDVATTTYTFLEADLGKVKRFTNASGCSATIPSGLSDGWNCLWSRSEAAGNLTFIQGASTTVRASDGVSSLVAETSTLGTIVPDAEGINAYQVTGTGSVTGAETPSLSRQFLFMGC